MHASKDPLKVIAYSSDDKQKLSEGILLTTDNAIDTSTGTIKLKAQFANAEDRLWPGQFVNAHLQLGVARNAVTVPSSAGAARGGRPVCLRGEAGRPSPGDPVEAGQDDGTADG